MPNYVTNEIKFNATAKQMEKIMNAVRRDGDEYGSFDFNKLIPMPESLDLTEGSITDTAVSAYGSYVRFHDPQVAMENTRTILGAIERIAKGRFGGINTYMTEMDVVDAADKNNMTPEALLSLGKQYVDNQLEHGAPSWYHWAIDNWGTKWNTSEGSVISDDNTLRFDTAWSAPLPILQALSERFPKIEMTHTWADEDIGQNVGQLKVLNGEVIEDNVPEPGSAEAYKMAFDLLGIEPQSLNLRFDVKSGTYVYDESMEEGFDEVSDSLDNLIDLAQAKADHSVPDDKAQIDRNTTPER